ncbi:MAG: hypothetical protein OEY26_06905, partial [Nitrospinota bacterium]|nr:hypothetical protein [Nitrospinota bacterium]
PQKHPDLSERTQKELVYNEVPPSPRFRLPIILAHSCFLIRYHKNNFDMMLESRLVSMFNNT